MRRFTLAVAVLVAGCGTPGTVEKQAEEVASIAAEGALLARDAREGETTETFTRVHARELAKKAQQLVFRTRDVELKRVAISVESDLQVLSEYPGQRQVAAGMERGLADSAKRAEEIAKAAE
jgi:hypothetical protein